MLYGSIYAKTQEETKLMTEKADRSARDYGTGYSMGTVRCFDEEDRSGHAGW